MNYALLVNELLETLVNITLIKEEEIKLKIYNGDLSRLGSAKRFLKAVLDIPLAFKIIEAKLISKQKLSTYIYSFLQMAQHVLLFHIILFKHVKSI